MASPRVAALVGLLAPQGRSNGENRLHILYTAVDLGFAGPNSYYGYATQATRAVH